MRSLYHTDTQMAVILVEGDKIHRRHTDGGIPAMFLGCRLLVWWSCLSSTAKMGRGARGGQVVLLRAGGLEVRWSEERKRKDMCRCLGNNGALRKAAGNAEAVMPLSVCLHVN